MKKITLAELQIIEKLVGRGLHITDHHADAYLAAKHHVDPANWYPNEPPDKVARTLLTARGAITDRPAAIKHIQRKDLYIATGGLLHMRMIGVHEDVHDDNIYRISIFPDGADVVCFGLDSVDSQLEGHYDDVNALPDWVKERLAVLNMMPSTPPTNEVAGVGRRISGHVYWVFAPDTTDASTSA